MKFFGKFVYEWSEDEPRQMLSYLVDIEGKLALLVIIVIVFRSPV